MDSERTVATRQLSIEEVARRRSVSSAWSVARAAWNARAIVRDKIESALFKVESSLQLEQGTEMVRVEESRHSEEYFSVVHDSEKVESDRETWGNDVSDDIIMIDALLEETIKCKAENSFLKSEVKERESEILEVFT